MANLEPAPPFRQTSIPLGEGFPWARKMPGWRALRAMTSCLGPATLGFHGASLRSKAIPIRLGNPTRLGCLRTFCPFLLPEHPGGRGSPFRRAVAALRAFPARGFLVPSGQSLVPKPIGFGIRPAFVVSRLPAGRVLSGATAAGKGLPSGGVLAIGPAHRHALPEGNDLRRVGRHQHSHHSGRFHGSSTALVVRFLARNVRKTSRWRLAFGFAR